MNKENDVDRVRSDVEHNFPDIRIDSIRFLSEGIGSKAFVVNDDMIFRFPKDAATIAEIEREIAVLPRLREYVNAMYESYLSDDRNFAYAPVFLHGDLGANHIIYNPDTRSISGVIDFGGMCIGDPDRDFTYLYVDYWGPDFARQFPKYYDDRDMDLLVRKLEFFNRCNPVDHLLTGLKREDDGLVRYASKRLEADAGSQAHR